MIDEINESIEITWKGMKEERNKKFEKKEERLRAERNVRNDK